MRRYILSYCDCLRVADVYSAQQANHIYFITEEYVEKDRYLRCRLCGAYSELPENATVLDSRDHDALVPSDKLLEQSNAALLEEKADRLEVQLPESISRSQ